MASRQAYVLTTQAGEAFLFDAVVTLGVAESSELSKHPVERGADITDHIQRHPLQLTLKGTLSDTPLLPAAPSPGRYQAMLDRLRALHRAGEPLTVTADLEVFEQLVITSLDYERSAKAGRSVEVELAMEEIILVNQVVVEIPEIILRDRAAQRSSDANVGVVSGVAVNADATANARGQSANAAATATNDQQPGSSWAFGLL